MEINPTPDAEREAFEALLKYDAETGVLTWKAKPYRGIVVGSEAGSIRTFGYRRIRIFGREHCAHRIAWLLHFGEWPRQHLDHINGKRADNRIANLRLADFTLNGENQRRPQKNNRSGFLGVVADGSDNHRPWKAVIKVAGRSKSIGHFDTPEEAHDAYIKAKRQLHKGCTL